MSRTSRNHWIFLLPALLVVIGDQLLKHWIRMNVPLHTTRELWSGVVELTYWKNTGAAFSMFSEHTWLLSLISAMASIAVLVILLRGIFPHLLGKISLALLLGGAVGNLIDRVWFGYVVDMFSLQFMNFAIFNIADIGVTVGGVLLCIYVLFIWSKDNQKEELAEAAVQAEPQQDREDAL